MVHRELELTKNLLAQRALLANSLTIMPSKISLLTTDGYIKLISFADQSPTLWCLFLYQPTVKIWRWKLLQVRAAMKA